MTAMLLSISLAVFSQTSEKLRIEHYTLGEKEIAIFPFDKSQKITVGKINSHGFIHFNWPAIKLSDFNTGYNVIENGGVFLNMCDEIKNYEGNLEGVKTLHAGFIYVRNGTRPDGIIVPASSSEVSISLFGANGKNDAEGSYLIWVYANTEASYNGTCKVNNSAAGDTIQSQKTFDLHLKQGWNLTRFEIEKVLIDKAGYTYPIKTKISTIDKYPGDIQWFFNKL